MEKLFLLVAFGVITHAVEAQGNFLNLGFESANLPPVPQGQPGERVPTSQAMPGWSAYVGSLQLDTVLQNNFNLGGANISILTPNWPANGIIEGRNTVLLQAGGLNSTFVNASISQFGLVPVGIMSIFLKASGNNFSVSLSGQEIPLIPIAFESNYTLYGGDVSEFAGLSGQLTLSSLTSPERQFNNVSFDSISFSLIPVPEPSALGLLGVGSLLLFSMARWRLFRPNRIKSNMGE